MFWLFGLLMLVLLVITWLMSSVLEMDLDTRIPQAELRWGTIGRVRVWFEQEWLIRFKILFFSRTFTLSELQKKPGKPKGVLVHDKKPSRFKQVPGRMWDVVRSFKVTECRLAIDIGDNAANARLYFLNYVPLTRGHLFVNFNDENHLVLKVRNRPWRIFYAFFRRSIV
jgi:hypothetical protein